MMKTAILTLLLSATCLAVNAQTNPVTRSVNWVKDHGRIESADLFQKGECVLSIGTTWTAPEPRGIEHVFKQDLDDGKNGLRFGVGYFLSEYVGLAVAAGMTDLHNPPNMIFDTLAADLILRVPIDRVAPYAKVGLGRNFQDGVYYVEAGPGVEVRLNKRLGIFAEALFQFRDQKKNDALQLGVGFNVVF